MKYLISLLMSLSAWSAPIQILYEGEELYARSLKTVMTEDYAIPDELISLTSVQECPGPVKRGKLDLCLKNNGDLLIVSADREFVSESLKIFRAP